MIIRSSDAGKTWSRPATLIDTPDDDRHPAFLQVPDGPLLCSLFTYSGAERAEMLKNHELAQPYGDPSLVRPRHHVGQRYHPPADTIRGRRVPTAR